MAIIRFCAGNARETAVKAFSLICATNILSTMLYNACTSIEIIMGNAMEINSLLTGITPILFSSIFRIPPLFRFQTAFSSKKEFAE